MYKKPLIYIILILAVIVSLFSIFNKKENTINCELPMEYAIQSNCPFTALEINGQCSVFCPITYHAPNPNISKSYLYSCKVDSDCDCSERFERSLECKCLSGGCYSLEDRLLDTLRSE